MRAYLCLNSYRKTQYGKIGKEREREREQASESDRRIESKEKEHKRVGCC